MHKECAYLHMTKATAIATVLLAALAVRRRALAAARRRALAAAHFSGRL